GSWLSSLPFLDSYRRIGWHDDFEAQAGRRHWFEINLVVLVHGNAKGVMRIDRRPLLTILIKRIPGERYFAPAPGGRIVPPIDLSLRNCDRLFPGILAPFGHISIRPPIEMR